MDEEAVAKAEMAAAADKTERIVNYRKVVVTDVQKGNLKFAAQSVDDGIIIASFLVELTCMSNLLKKCSN